MFPEKLPVYFEMPMDGQRVLGEEFKFQFPKFGVFAWSQEEAEEKVRQWHKKFAAEVKQKKNKAKNEEVPFPDNLHNKR